MSEVVPFRVRATASGLQSRPPEASLDPRDQSGYLPAYPADQRRSLPRAPQIKEGATLTMSTPSATEQSCLAHQPPADGIIDDWIQRFHRDGCLFLRNVLPPDWCAELRRRPRERSRQPRGGDREAAPPPHVRDERGQPAALRPGADRHLRRAPGGARLPRDPQQQLPHAHRRRHQRLAPGRSPPLRGDPRGAARQRPSAGAALHLQLLPHRRRHRRARAHPDRAALAPDRRPGRRTRWRAAATRTGWSPTSARRGA